MGCAASAATAASGPAGAAASPGSSEFSPDSKPAAKEGSTAAGPAAEKATTSPTAVDAAPQGAPTGGTKNLVRRVGDIVNGASEFDDEPAGFDREDGTAAAQSSNVVTPLHHHPPGSPDYDEFGYGQASPLRTQQQQQQQQASSPQRGFAPPAPRGFGPGPEDSAEAYYPQQVALRVAAPRRPVSPVEQTSIVRLSDGGSSSSPPSHSPPPQLPVAALHRLPSHPCEVPDVVVRGVQGTTGRGAAAAQPPYPSLAAAAPVVDPDDPWSRLQTQYRIDSVPAGAPLPRAGYMLAASPLPAPRAVPAAAPAQQQQQRKGMLVLGDDDAGYDTGLYGVPGGRGGQDRAPKAPAPAAAVKPKQGGWGNGNLASAGTLMLGQEDWAAAAEQRQHDQQQQQQQYQQLPAADAYAHAHAHAPRGPAGMGDPKQSMDDLDEMYREVVTNERQPPAAVTKSKVVHDMVFEDIDDVDKMLEEEFMNQGLKDKHLADKLRAFEMAFAHDDD